MRLIPPPTLKLLLMIAFLVTAIKTQAATPAPLHVSQNGHYLIDANGTGFFPVADTAWAIAWKLTREEVNTYLQRRKEQKFNTIALVAFPSYEGPETLPNAYGDSAFALRDGRWNPEKPVLTPGENPENPTEYDYWDHLAYVIDTAEAKGMYIVLLPAWGGCVAGDWGDGHPTSEIIFDATSAYNYAYWIGQRFKHKKNILWMMGGDRSAVYGERDYRGVFRAMAEGIADGVNGIARQDGKADYSTTLISFHPRKWLPNSAEWFHNDPWLDFNSIQDQPKDQIAAIASDYRLLPAKPTWLFEGGYEYRGRGEAIYKDWQIRFQAYQTVFAGGFGVTYGSMNVYHFNNGTANLNETGAMDMQHLVTLMASLSNEQFLDRIPDQALIEGDVGGMDGGEGIRSSCIQAMRGSRGDYAMIYSANGRTIRVKMDRLSAPRVNAFWFNPRSGTWQIDGTDFSDQRPFMERISSGAAVPVQAFDPPGSPADGNDWVLLLKAAE